MDESSAVVSKVLVLDTSLTEYETLKNFCDQHNLIGLKPVNASLSSILATYLDLGAIFMADDFGGNLDTTLAMAQQIHNQRPELPIALRRTAANAEDNRPESMPHVFCLTYSIDNLQPLETMIQRYIFSLEYPNVLVRGVAELTQNAFASQLPGYSISVGAPYLVKDRIVMGSSFSMIPIDSTWCRGYMVLQADIESVVEANHAGNDSELDPTLNCRAADRYLGELTNLVWGGFKRRFVGDSDGGGNNCIQVPVIANYEQKSLSFGTEKPYLCFKYQLKNNATGLSIPIYQWFVFNLNWSSEYFKSINSLLHELNNSIVQQGELELF
jgi:hypothetical protein